MSCFVDGDTVQQCRIDGRRDLVYGRFQVPLDQPRPIRARAAKRITRNCLGGGAGLTKKAVCNCAEIEIRVLLELQFCGENCHKSGAVWQRDLQLHIEPPTADDCRIHDVEMVGRTEQDEPFHFGSMVNFL